MIELSEIIMALWFLPVTAFIIVLLGAVFGLFFGLLSSLFSMFKPVSGQRRKPVEISS